MGVEPRGERVALEVRPTDGPVRREILVDGVVAGIGIRPNVEMPRAAGLEVDDGIRVDELLRTSHPDIHAAGDVASFHNPARDKRIRVEHEDNANTMGRAAGRAMAGAGEPYHHLPFFHSDLFELGYEAVGEIDARLEVVADWKEPNREGVLYYLQEGRVRGVLLWNVWEQVDAARRLMLALAAHQQLSGEGVRSRVVSMPSWELFEAQPVEYRHTVLPPTVRARVSIEAGSPFGWERYVGSTGAIIGVNHFGASAPGPVVMAHHGFTVEHLVATAREVLANNRLKGLGVR